MPIRRLPVCLMLLLCAVLPLGIAATQAAADVPLPISPIGATTETQPTFRWTSIGQTAWYYLWISGPNGHVLDQWYDGWHVCGGGCSVTLPFALSNGMYQWWIQAWTAASGYSAWSQPAQFTIEDIPATPVPQSPTGTIAETNPTFTWIGAPGAAWYYLWVSRGDVTIYSTWYNGADICGGANCAIQPTLNLVGGSYTWWVQMWTPLGSYSPWSEPAQFVLPLPPAAPNLIAPTGTITQAQPTFYWSNVPAVKWFYLWISDMNGHVLDQWFNAYDICGASTCALGSPLPLPDGAYRWWVQGWSIEGGNGAWSAQGNFTVDAVSGSAEITPAAAAPN